MGEGCFVAADRRWEVWVDEVGRLGAWRIVVVGEIHVVGTEAVDHGEGGGVEKGEDDSRELWAIGGDRKHIRRVDFVLAVENEDSQYCVPGCKIVCWCDTSAVCQGGLIEELPLWFQ